MNHSQRSKITPCYKSFSSSRLLGLLSISIFFFYACRRHHVGPEINSCKASQKDSSFQIRELIGIDPTLRYFQTDTVVASRNAIYFMANDSTADEYLWTFGADPRVFSGRSVNLVFDQPIGKIEVTLSVTRNTSNPCYGQLPAKSFYKKELTIVAGSQNPIIGNYYGYNTSDKSKLFYLNVLQNGIKNIPIETKGSYYLQNEVIYGSSAFYIAGAGTYDPDFGAYATEGFGFVKDDHTLEIDYTYKYPTSTSTYVLRKDTFYGIRQ